MSDLLVTDIGCLVTNDASLDETPLGILHDAAFAVTAGKVSWVGAKSAVSTSDYENVISANGKTVIPGFVDSHNHLIFAGDRADEFSARMQGKPYTAGGINYTVEKTRNASKQELRDNAAALVLEGLKSGTTTVEIKSGYGLNCHRHRLHLCLQCPNNYLYTAAHFRLRHHLHHLHPLPE